MTFKVKASQLGNFMELYRLARKKMKENEPVLLTDWGQESDEFPTGFVTVHVNNENVGLEYRLMMQKLYCGD